MNKFDEIFQKVKFIIKEILDDVEVDKINPDSTLRDDLGMDSLASVEIVMTLEDTFFIEFSEQVLDKIHTVRDLIEFIMATPSLENC